MSTRAVYTFKDESDTFHVYKHHDGYPSGAIQWIVNALEFAWPLPRFEACEFSAAFIAGNKPREKGSIFKGGGVYCTHDWKNHGDLDYRYEIELHDNELFIRAFEVSCENCRLIFEGNLSQFEKFVEKNNG